MLNENAKAWVAALRSGEYEQGRDFLHSATQKFCCLGVACDLAVKAKLLGSPILNNNYFEYDNGYWGNLPQVVAEWLGLNSNSTIGSYNGLNGSLAQDNDKGKTFPEIADIIESEPEGLFLPAPSPEDLPPAAGAVSEYAKLSKEELGQ